jgi:hypothetical protein
MSSTVIAVRTHRFGSWTEDWCRRLQREAPCRVVIVADESDHVAPVPVDLRKVAVSTAWARGRGLHVTEDAMWRCGDYGLYAVREAVPDASCIWLLDHDTRINSDHLGDFFGPEAWPEADLLAAFYRRAEPDWAWYEAIRTFYRIPYRCMFPIVRLSAVAVDGLYRERIRIGVEFARSGGSSDWPNDESFVATYLTGGGAVCRDLNHGAGAAYGDDTYSWIERPISAAQLDATSRDGKIYHPVSCGQDYLAAMRRALHMHRRQARAPDEITTKFDDAALQWIAAACGTDAARAFAREVEAAVRACPVRQKDPPKSPSRPSNS